MPSVTCGRLVELLHKRADARLSVTEGAALDGHLTSCAACRERASVLVGAADGLSRPKPAPAGFSDRIVRRIGALPARPQDLRSPSRFRLGSFLPAAAALLIAFGFVAQWRGGPSQEGTPEPQVQVELELVDVQARSVAVAGDFNEWSASEMRKGGDGIWRVRLSLPPGRYQYVFVVDGDKWIADPRASTVVDSGYSGTNSVLDVSL